LSKNGVICFKNGVFKKWRYFVFPEKVSVRLGLGFELELRFGSSEIRLNTFSVKCPFGQVY